MERQKGDHRQSLEVFNPKNYFELHSSSIISSSPSSSFGEQLLRQPPESMKVENQIHGSLRKVSSGKEPVDKWMAFTRESGTSNTVEDQQSLENSKNGKSDGNTSKGQSSQILTEASMAERAAEWGLVIKSQNGRDSTNQIGIQRLSAGGIRSTDFSRSSGDSVSSLNFPRVSKELKDALSTLQQTFVVSDATRLDYPVMYASAGFFSMTGYSSKEVIGRNCRFLQGPDTNPVEIGKIREAVRTGKSYCGRLLNYKKDETPFWNLLTITPIKDDKGKVIKYIGMQVEVSKYTEGTNEKALRPNGLSKSLIRYDARQKEKALSSITEVVQTVRHPHSDTQDVVQEKNTEQERFFLDSPLLESGEIGKFKSSGRKISQMETKSDLSRMSLSSEASKKSGKFSRVSLVGFKGRSMSQAERHEPGLEVLVTKDIKISDSWELSERDKDIRQGIDLATTLERIEKNFVITDPRLPDNPIIFASDSFLELTEYTREEILGRNCRFLQGPDTDQETVKKIRDAIREQREITVQLINYTKSGKKFWNLFHLQPMRDQKGELQYFIGVQLDGSDHLEPLHKRLSENTETKSAKLVKATADNVDGAVRELPDANLSPEGLWAIHSQPVFPRPHKKNNSCWRAIQKVTEGGEQIGLKHFKPIKPLGCGDTGSVHLVELLGTGEVFAMKATDKSVMLNRNKVHRACIEREISSLLDHPFLSTLYMSFQTSTHVCLITDFCPGGELFALLDRQPMKIFREEAARFYAAEVVVSLEYLHCLGIIYRDLKPENILLQADGHVVLTDFDLSFLASCKPHVIKHAPQSKRKNSRSLPPPIFVSEPATQSNSFVGTEEYIAPEIITGAGHSSAIDWWALGILLFEMLYGRTPFRGKNRQKTFANILYKDLTFPTVFK
ncbi:phototropin-2-like isoform X1 [Aristolochia californica]|uniref:phototropin-2-like isoform X1 n=1 Tax=Aristolochia californica TaxID=171875 RepID=UPI0035DC1B50